MRMRVAPVLALAWLASAAVPGGAQPPRGAALRPELRRPTPRRIVPNDNRVPGGRLRGGELVLRLVAGVGEWHPDGDAQPGIEVQAFGEEGGPLRIPGPLLRVRQGSRVHAYVRNGVPGATLVLHGLGRHGGAAELDTIVLTPGATRELRFDAGVPGTYYYWATTTGAATIADRRGTPDTPLTGAFIVDPAGAPAPADRVFVLGVWADQRVAELNDLSPVVFRMTINGLSWPETERLTYALGDTVRWRVVNGSAAAHPMHLHGFYFRVESRGDGTLDNTAERGFVPLREVTERMGGGSTFSLVWVPERPGNWLFHCHDNVHIRPPPPLPGAPPRAVPMAHANHALTGMAGLVMGVEVRPAAGADLKAAPAESTPRRLRLIANADARSTAREPAYAFSLEDPRGTISPPSVPGPAIVLTRGEPVAITVVNRVPEPMAVHWHGIELDSYYDGVAGFAGHPGHIAPAVEPGDSFEARFTPPRAGTFIYHTHVDEVRQQRAGLSGPLIVLEPGARFDPSAEILLFITTPRLDVDRDRVYVNGSVAPDTLRLRAGAHYRVRVVNIHTYRPSLRVMVKRDESLLQWRSLAKDGADLPPEQATVRPSAVQLGNGETYDFELVPSAPGMLHVDVLTAVGTLLTSMPVRVD